ncbi:MULTISPECIES: HD domain-containing protein [Winogradskyella]|uniref:HD domain-containing protein n=1 Tax=Winogradskyella TaxID=286104 RepID=UPI001B22E462|nr:HD domain-containing protein [Winogradskyella sp.]MBO6880107.1 HD domain-containing protein [Winogradskyella sp.]
MKVPFKKIQAHVFELLEKNLPSYLTYHSVEHTRYVLEKVIYIASKENISKSDLLLLKIAALYHDVGFIKSHENHEEIGCEIASKDLKGFHFSTEDIDSVCGMIMATKIPQDPKNHLEEILADADLEYLGTKHFFSVSELLYKELKYFNKELTPQEWYNIQVDFINNHTYHTNYCKHYKSFRKYKNLEKLMYQSGNFSKK